MKVKIKVYDIAVDQGRLIGILRRMWVEEESGETGRGNDVRSRTVTTFLWAPYLALPPRVTLWPPQSLRSGVMGI